MKLDSRSQRQRNLSRNDKNRTGIYMEIEKRLIKGYLDSAYLQKQVDALTGAYELLCTVDRGSHLTSFQRLVMRQATQIIDELAKAHRCAIGPMVTYENEEKLKSETAKNILDIKSSCLNVSGKVALVVYESPTLLDRNELTMKSDAEALVCQQFLWALESMARLAIEEADKRNISIDVAVNEAWEKFEQSRMALEQKLSRRIRAYEKQLTVGKDSLPSQLSSSDES